MYLNDRHKSAMGRMVMGDLDNALDALSLLIEEMPEEPDLWHDRGLVHYHANRKGDALSDMNRAQRIQPDYSYRYSSRAFIKDSLGDVRGAIEDYEIAVKLDPDDAVAHNNLGLLQEKLGYHDKAKIFTDLADKIARNEGITPADSNRDSSNSVREASGAPGPRNIQKEIDDKKRNAPKEHKGDRPGFWPFLRHVFGTRRGWTEFVTFVRNGFRVDKPK